MRMESAWVWLLLPLLLVWVWWLARKSYAHLRPQARALSVALRIAIMILLLGALARPVFMRATRGQHVLFLLDVSRSVSRDNLAAAMQDIDRLARQSASGGHRVSLIAFGRGAQPLLTAERSWNGLTDAHKDLILHETAIVDLNAQRAKLIAEGATGAPIDDLQKRIAAVESFRTEVVGDQTDARAALRLALNTGAIGEAKAFYLFTDGNFNRGDTREILDAAQAAGHKLHAVALDRPIPPEVAATDITIPSTVRVNQGFSADVRVASTVETPARIAVYRDGFAAAEFTQQLHPGVNSIRLPGLFFRDKGFHAIDVAVRAEKDTNVENNKVRSLVVVPGELRVLYADSEETQQSYLVSALELEGVQVQARPASGVPQTLDELLGYDALILGNIPADKLNARQMQMIRTYVQDFGGGLIMLGGDQSFGLGGYYGTPVEEVLPVRMPIQKDLNRPSLAIMLVIDKSGSMEGPKIQLAKRAATATAEVINPRDQIGIVGFDSEAQPILDLTPAGDRATIDSSIAELDASGGTFLYPALEIAQSRLQQSNARKKHVIILSDGQTQGFGYPEIAQAMAAEGITVSTVGIGEGADMKLMESIASSGGGRSYFTNDFYAIPQIFTREALRAANSMLIERLVLPSVAADDESIAEVDAAELPPLNGYVATTPKETAKVVMISDSGDPILARWRSGLGRTAAFTSDTKPKWAEEWIKWPDFAKFWAQLVRGVAGHEVARDVSIEAASSMQDDTVRLTADLRDVAGNFVTDRALELTVFDPQTGTRSVPVEQESPGLFAASVPQTAYGRSTQLAWKIPEQSGPGGKREAVTVPFGFVQSFSPEFRTLGPDQAEFDRIRSMNLGEVRPVGQAELALGTRTGRERITLWPWLLIAALMLVPFDILCRRWS